MLPIILLTTHPVSCFLFANFFRLNISSFIQQADSYVLLFIHTNDFYLVQSPLKNLHDQDFRKPKLFLYLVWNYFLGLWRCLSIGQTHGQTSQPFTVKLPPNESQGSIYRTNEFCMWKNLFVFCEICYEAILLLYKVKSEYESWFIMWKIRYEEDFTLLVRPLQNWLSFWPWLELNKTASKRCIIIMWLLDDATNKIYYIGNGMSE